MKNYFEKLISQYNLIKNRLMDEESVTLFDARIEYAITGDWDAVEDIFFTPQKKWRCIELENFLKDLPGRKEIVLFGAGQVGRKTKKYLEMCGYAPICFCDNHVIKGMIDGIPVISVDEFIENSENSIIIICSILYKDEMYHQLIDGNVSAARILLPGGNRIQLHCDQQYFDLFSPKLKEVFIDAGGFNGDTVVEFFSWLGDGEGKCYSLEPVQEMYNQIVERSKKENWKDVVVCNCAAWDKEEKVFITKDQKENGRIWGGSCIDASGEVIVNGMSIDSICAEEEVTFIKMDVEGSELKALKGAENIIRKQKPRLAISIYHKPLDIFEIPYYILSLVPEYKMYIRHYSADFTETVLYAEI